MSLNLICSCFNYQVDTIGILTPPLYNYLFNQITYTPEKHISYLSKVSNTQITMHDDRSRIMFNSRSFRIMITGPGSWSLDHGRLLISNNSIIFLCLFWIIFFCVFEKLASQTNWEETSHFTIMLIIGGKVNTKSTMTRMSYYSCYNIGIYVVLSRRACARGKNQIYRNFK